MKLGRFMKVFYLTVLICITCSLRGQDGFSVPGMIGRSSYLTSVHASDMKGVPTWEIQTEEPPISIGYVIKQTTKLISAYETDKKTIRS